MPVPAPVPVTQTTLTIEQLRCSCTAPIGEDFRCLSCQANCFFGVETGTCGRCGRETSGVRKGLVWTSNCECHVSPEQLAYIDHLRKKDHARDVRYQRINEQVKADQQAAGECWERKRANGCSVRSKTSGPYDYCAVCKKWKTNQ